MLGSHVNMIKDSVMELLYSSLGKIPFLPFNLEKKYVDEPLDILSRNTEEENYIFGISFQIFFNCLALYLCL